MSDGHRGPWVLMCVLSHQTVTLWTVACQTPLSVGFPREE